MSAGVVTSSDRPDDYRDHVTISYIGRMATKARVAVWALAVAALGGCGGDDSSEGAAGASAGGTGGTGGSAGTGGSSTGGTSGAAGSEGGSGGSSGSGGATGGSGAGSPGGSSGSGGFVPEPGPRSVVYPADWQPGYETTRPSDDAKLFIQDFSYAGYRNSEQPLPTGDFADVIDVDVDTSGATDVTAAIQASSGTLPEQAASMPTTRAWGTSSVPDPTCRSART